MEVCVKPLHQVPVKLIFIIRNNDTVHNIPYVIQKVQRTEKELELSDVPMYMHKSEEENRKCKLLAYTRITVHALKEALYLCRIALRAALST